ncbi:hypothetical protein C8R46DRAFT_141527 [Mycena filopes]|nr:hypothetical protein C8R46DRAFT_141527 [Mycena filopes]
MARTNTPILTPTMNEMTLLNLPNELLALILVSLLRKNHAPETLAAVRLINRRLLAIAHPLAARYLCLEGNFGTYNRPILPDSREAHFRDFFSDDARAGAVQHLTLTGHVENSGRELLNRLCNITHLEISGAWMAEEDGGECYGMVYTLVAAFPALSSLRLADCYQEDEDFDEFQDDLQDDPHHADLNGNYPEIISTSLRHVVCENVDPAFRQLWLATPSVEVIEMHMCKPKPWGYGSREIGVHRILLRDPIFCGKVKRLHVEHAEHHSDEDEEEAEVLSDAENISTFFEWRARVLPCLQELILEVPFELEHLQHIFSALPEICPRLKRFKFGISTQGYKDFTASASVDIFQPSGELQHLEEVRVPMSGLGRDITTAISCLFANSPKLARVHFSNPGIDGNAPSDAVLLACAERYAAAVPALKSVSWDRYATVDVGAPSTMRAFQKSWCQWEERTEFEDMP